VSCFGPIGEAALGTLDLVSKTTPHPQTVYLRFPLTIRQIRSRPTNQKIRALILGSISVLVMNFWISGSRTQRFFEEERSKYNVLQRIGKKRYSENERQFLAIDRCSAMARRDQTYAQEDVERLRGSFRIEYTLAREGAKRLRNLLKTEPPVTALGALSGNQAVQQVRAGLKAIYPSGWQVAADANLSEQMYPDQSLYAANSVPAVVRRIMRSTDYLNCQN
jgi:hypothetical protein